MHQVFSRLFTGLLMAGIAAALVVSPASMAAPPQKTYRLDPGHTRVLYSVSHMGFSFLPGSFSNVNGTIQFDASKPENAMVDVIIDASKLSMDNEALDKKLQGTDYFNTIKYPVITYKSTKVVKTDISSGTMTGDLSLLGVTKPVKLKVRFNRKGLNKYANATTIGFSAWGKINRSDFGMKTLLPDVGDAVELHIEVEAAEIVPMAELPPEAKAGNPAAPATVEQQPAAEPVSQLSGLLNSAGAPEAPNKGSAPTAP